MAPSSISCSSARACAPPGTSATLRWIFTADDDIYTSPTLAADGTLYFGTLAGSFYALTPGSSSATKKWSITLPAYNGADASITSSPALAPDGTIYFAAYDHKLYALNPATGTTKWTYPLGNEVRASSPAVAADGTDLQALPRPKSAPEKVRLAAAMKRTTAASNGWLATQLAMGQPASVSQFVRRWELDPSRRREIDRLQSRVKA